MTTSNSNVRPAARHHPRAAALITAPSVATSSTRWLASASFILCSSSASRWDDRSVGTCSPGLNTAIGPRRSSHFTSLTPRSSYSRGSRSKSRSSWYPRGSRSWMTRRTVPSHVIGTHTTRNATAALVVPSRRTPNSSTTAATTVAPATSRPLPMKRSTAWWRVGGRFRRTSTIASVLGRQFQVPTSQRGRPSRRPDAASRPLVRWSYDRGVEQDSMPDPAVDLDLRKLRYFIAVAEEMHFGRAAERLYVAQPALSRQIQRLEEQLGVALFARTSRSVELTDAGRKLLSEGKALLAAAQATQRRVRRAAERARVLTVGFFTGDPVTPATRAFGAAHPDVVVDVVRVYWFDQADVLFDGRADVAFVHLPVAEPGLGTVSQHRPEARWAPPQSRAAGGQHRGEARAGCCGQSHQLPPRFGGGGHDAPAGGGRRPCDRHRPDPSVPGVERRCRNGARTHVCGAGLRCREVDRARLRWVVAGAVTPN